MKLSFTTLGCPDWNLEDIARNAKSYGYDGIELRTAPDGNHLSPDASASEAQRVAKLFRDAGVPVMSIMGYTRFAFLDQAEITKNQELMRKLIPMAVAMQVPFIRTFAGQLPKGADRDRIVRNVAEALKPLAAEAHAQGITIGLETHDDWCGGDLVMQVVNIINSKGFGIVYDIYNAFHSGIEPWDVTYEKVKAHIVYCHLKDGYTGLDGNAHYVFLGAGDLPVREMLARFKSDGYDGFFSFEWEKKWHPHLAPPEESFPHFAHKLRALWSTAGSGG